MDKTKDIIVIILISDINTVVITIIGWQAKKIFKVARNNNICIIFTETYLPHVKNYQY